MVISVQQGLPSLKSAEVIELGGAEKNTTNNRMELVAVIEGLKKIEKLQIERLKDSEAQVKIYTDSSYVINGITKWIHGWKRNG